MGYFYLTMLAAAAAAVLLLGSGTDSAPWPLTQLPVTAGGAGRPGGAVLLTSFGGRGDDATDNTKAFADALAHLAAAGGGTLVVPSRSAGSGGGVAVYRSMPIVITSNFITLRIESQVKVIAICDITNWPIVPGFASFTEGTDYAPFVHAVNVTDLVIEGDGGIDGNGSCFWDANHAEGHHGKLNHTRPRNVVVEGSKRVSLQGITTSNSAYWNLVLFQTDDVHVKGVVVRNPSGGVGPCPQPDGQPCFGPNADGIDLVSVRRALVEEMDITAGDDCVCIKSGENGPGRAVARPTESILIRNMRLNSCSCPHIFHGLGDGCGGMKVGTEMSGGVLDVRFETSTIEYAGIALKLSAPVPRGGSVSNITFQGINIVRAGMAIGIDVNLPNATPPAAPPAADIAAIRDIKFLDIHLGNVSCCPGCVDYGCKDHNAGWIQAGNAPAGSIHELTFRNVTAHSGSDSWKTAGPESGAATTLTWLCSEPGSLFGTATAVTPPLACLSAQTSASPPRARPRGNRRTLSTWIGVGTAGPQGGMGGADNTEALAWLHSHHDRISSLSITGYGKPGSKNVSALQFNTAAAALGVDTYVLWGGDWDSFATPAAIGATVAQTLDMVKKGGYTGVDLDFEHPQTWGPDWPAKMGNDTFAAELRSKYSDFLRALSAALHHNKLKMSECVGTYPTADGGVDVFYDTAVVAATNDVVRVMNYDMYYVGGRGGTFPGRPDCTGMGPTSTAPWAEFSMRWWLDRVPASKLVMGIPAYSNDYSALPFHGGANGSQAAVGPPGDNTADDVSAGATDVEAIWDYWSQIYTYMYKDAAGSPRVRYGTDVNSTKAHLKTAAKLGVAAVGFWTGDMTDTEMADALWDWTGE